MAQAKEPATEQVAAEEAATPRPNYIGLLVFEEGKLSEESDTTIGNWIEALAKELRINSGNQYLTLDWLLTCPRNCGPHDVYLLGGPGITFYDISKAEDAVFSVIFTAIGGIGNRLRMAGFRCLDEKTAQWVFAQLKPGVSTMAGYLGDILVRAKVNW